MLDIIDELYLKFVAALQLLQNSNFAVRAMVQNRWSSEWTSVNQTGIDSWETKLE